MSYRKVMPWGKHRGEPLHRIRASYLWWVLEECDTADRQLRQDIVEELSRRLPTRPAPTPPAAPNYDREYLAGWFRRAAMACHPDQGGSARAMKLINELRGMLL